MANLDTQNIGTNYRGILNLGPTINTDVSTTLQPITDGSGNNSALSISTTSAAINQIYIGNDTAEFTPSIYNSSSANINISLNPSTVVVSNGYSTGSYASGNTPSAIFEVASTTQGMLLPRMTTTERNNINTPVDGLIVYDTTRRSICYFAGINWYELTSTKI
jgi:hypothetical protein